MVLWPSHEKRWLIGKYSDAGRDLGQEEKGMTGWEGWMTSPTRWTWVWVNSLSWWWTGRPGVLQFMGLQRIGRDWGTELNWTEQNATVIANTLFQQHKRRLYTCTSPDGQQQNQIDYVLCSQWWRGSVQSAKTRPGPDYGSDHELLIAKFGLKLKKVGKPLDHSGMT